MRDFDIAILVFFVLIHVLTQFAAAYGKENCTIVTEGFCIPKVYNKHQQPQPNETSLVQVKFTVEQLTAVDDSSFTISLIMFLSLYWRDDRIRYIRNDTETKPEEIPLSMEWAEELWLPDVYVRKMHSVKRPRILQEFGCKTTLDIKTNDQPNLHDKILIFQQSM